LYSLLRSTKRVINDSLEVNDVLPDSLDGERREDSRDGLGLGDLVEVLVPVLSEQLGDEGESDGGVGDGDGLDELGLENRRGRERERETRQSTREKRRNEDAFSSKRREKRRRREDSRLKEQPCEGIDPLRKGC